MSAPRLRLGLRRRAALRLSWGRPAPAQALVETALAAPFVLLLLVGGAQVGAISFGQVTIDSAAREGARVATEHPETAFMSSQSHQTFFSAAGPTTYTCKGSSDTNPVCVTVYSAPGLFQPMFDKSRFTVTITANAPVARAPQPAPDGVPDDVQRVACQGGVDVSGTVSGVSGNATYDVSASSSGQTLTTKSNPQGAYSLCIAISGTQTETLTASYGTLACGLPMYQGSTQLTVSAGGGPYTADITVTAQTCPTPTPTPSATPTSGTPLPTGTALPGSSGSFSCDSAASSMDGTYVTVQVSYPMAIFVPFFDKLFNSGGGNHTTTATVTMRIEPCGITQGT